MFRVKVFLFASLRDKLEEPVVQLLLEKSNWSSDDELKEYLLDKLKDRWLKKRASQIKLELPSSKTFMLAINEAYVTPKEPITINPIDVIALIPPVSGG